MVQKEISEKTGSPKSSKVSRRTFLAWDFEETDHLYAAINEEEIKWI